MIVHHFPRPCPPVGWPNLVIHARGRGIEYAEHEAPLSNKCVLLQAGRLQELMSRAPLIGLLSLWLVAGCSEPSGPLAPGEAALEFFPMVEGARWLYSVDLDPPSRRAFPRAH